MEQLRFIVALIVLATPVPVQAENRTWTDTSGEFKVEAELVSRIDGLAKLRKPDGSEANIPLEMLSESDQSYVDSFVEHGESSDNVGQALDTDPPDEAPVIGPRLWTERTSQRRLEATFIELRENVVTVRTPDGRHATVPMERLSDADRQYVRQVWQPLQAANANGQPKDSAEEIAASAESENVVKKASPANTLSAVPNRNFFDLVRDEFSLERMDRWRRLPRIAYLLATWFGLAAFTGVFAATVARSRFWWFILGLLLPGIATFLLPLLGLKKTSSATTSTTTLGAMRIGMILTSLAGLSGTAYLVSRLDNLTIATATKSLIDASPLLIGALVGVWIVNALLAGMTAALLRQSVLKWWTVSILLPFIGTCALSLIGTGSASNIGSATLPSGGKKTRESYCYYLFVLGGGREPMQHEAMALSQQFIRGHPNINFSRAKRHTGAVDSWQEQNKAGLVATVCGYFLIWQLGEGVNLDPSDIIYCDYYDRSNQPFVVAAYVS